MIAAPSSGAGKSMITLAVLRALKEAGRRVIGGKSGPDFLDPTFHQAACGAPSVNLDAWAMAPESLRARAAEAGTGAELMLIEGAMGLLDGAPDPAGPLGRGSSADLAEALGAPVVLVLDVARQGQSAAAIALGFRAARPGLRLAGVILNRVGSDRHRRLVEEALAAFGIRVFGAAPRSEALATPSRHLGLIAASERADLETFLKDAAALAARAIDLEALCAAASPLAPASAAPSRLPPLAQRIAVARDAAFSFAYPHLLADWRAAGAEISHFSPLAGEPPDPMAGAVYLARRLSRTACAGALRRGGVPRRIAGGRGLGRAGLWRMRGVHGSGAGVDGRAGAALAHGRIAAAGDQLRRAPSASRLSPAAAAGRRRAFRITWAAPLHRP